MGAEKQGPRELRAFLSGEPGFYWEGEELAVDAKKPLAMLCILTLRGGACERDVLAELLWGQGRLLNVRQALYQLRRLPGAEEWLDASERVSIRVSSDVSRFEEAAAAERYAEALEAWSPPLLGDASLPKSPAFLEWLEVERARLEGLYGRVLEERATELEREGRFEEALELVDRYLGVDPLRENGYRAAMRLSYLMGDQERAIAYYRRCARILRDEFESEPLPTTVELATAIAAGETLPIRVAPASLPEELRRLLRFVVVGKGQLSTAQLARAMEEDEFELASRLEELERRKLLGPGGTVPDETVREVRGALASAPVRLTAERIAGCLERLGTDGREAQLGELWLVAHEPERAAPYLLQELERVFREGLEEEVPLLAYRVLWCGSDAQRFEAALIYEEVAQKRGDLETQERLLELAHSLAWELQEDRALIREGLRRARYHLRRQNSGEAGEVAQEALLSARRIGDELLVAQAISTLGVTHFSRGDLAGARRYFEENLDSPVENEKFRSLNNLGAVAGMQGDLEGSYAYLEQALTLARRARRVHEISACLNNLAATAERLASYGEAVKRIQEGRDLARRSGSNQMGTQLLLNLAQVYYRQGALGPAWNTACEALDEARELDDLRLVGQAHDQLGEIARIAGDASEAQSLFELAAQAFEQVGDERKRATTRCNSRILDLYTGSSASSEEAVREVETLANLQQEISRWFWAELTLIEEKPDLVREWAKKIIHGAENRHLSFLTNLALLRASLLAGDEPMPSAEFLEQLEQLRVVEAPIAHAVVAACSHGVERERHLAKAREILGEQALGLPRRMRERHLDLLENYRGYLPEIELS